MFLFKNWYWLYSNLTEPELALEPAIAALGKRYRAQHLFAGLKHIVDFALLDDKIIIEVDGSSHTKPDQIRKDLEHTIKLESMGWRVVRCSNEAAKANPEHTLRLLLTDGLNHRPSLEELRARLLALGPAPVRVRTKRRARKPKSPRASAPSP